MAEVELYLLLLAVLLIGLAIFGGIAQRASGTNLRVFKYLKIGGIIGLLLIPLALLITTFSGRTNSFISAITTDLSGLLGSIGGSIKYSVVCKDGYCAQYCCRHYLDTSLVWKDCDEQCTSISNVRGENTGDGCLFNDMKNYCNSTGLSGRLQQISNGCNYNSAQGPITCFCCTDSGGTKQWWDCASDCSSDMHSVGYASGNNICSGVNVAYCRDKQIIVDVNTDTRSDDIRVSQ